MNKTPMSLETFKYYMKKLEEEWFYYNKCCNLGFDILEHSEAFNMAIDLLARIFNDFDESVLAWWIFECDWGTRKDMSISNDDKISFEIEGELIYIDTVEELYNYLVRSYNNEFIKSE